MKKRRSKILIGFIIIALGFAGFFLYVNYSWNPFDFGPCDGDGTPNEYVKYYYDNGKIKQEGKTDEWCKWTGIVKEYYESGNIKSEIEYEGGMTNGIAKYYSFSGKVFKTDSCLKNNIFYSKLTDTLNFTTAEFSKSTNNLRTKTNNRLLSEIVDKRMIIKETALIYEQIYIKTDKSVFVLNDSLNIIFNLYDSINKYAPDDFVGLNYDEKYILCGWFPENKPDSISCSIWINEYSDYKGEMKFKIK